MAGRARWLGGVVAAVTVLGGGTAHAAVPRDGDWQAEGDYHGWPQSVYFGVDGSGRRLEDTNSLVGNPTDPCSWAGKWADEPVAIAPDGSFSAQQSGAGPPATNNHIVTRGRFSNSGQAQVTMTVSCVRYRPGLPSPIPYRASETYAFTALLRSPEALGLGGALGGRAKVYVQTCAAADTRLLVRPKRQRRRGGRARVHPRRQVCSKRRQLTRTRGRRAWRLPDAIPSGAATFVPVPACPISLDVQGDGLYSRRWACPAPALFELISTVIAVENGVVYERVVGTGLATVGRRFELGGRKDPRWIADIGFRGTSGILSQGARMDVRPYCEFRYGTRCFGDPDNFGDIYVRTGTVGRIRGFVRPAALAGDVDFMQAQTQLQLRALTKGGPMSLTSGIPDPDMRCDNRLTIRTECVLNEFVPTLKQPPGRMPEIAAHIQRAQNAGFPGAVGGTPLTRTARANIRDNRRLACPERIRKQYRRARKGGSCDEYPFASTDQGGVKVSRANVPVRENNIQGGLISAFYANQRILTGDAFWVAPTP